MSGKHCAVGSSTHPALLINVILLCAFLTECLITAIGNRAKTDNLLKMTHFCARLGVLWFIITCSKLALCNKRKPGQRGTQQLAHCAFTMSREQLTAQGSPWLISEPHRERQRASTPSPCTVDSYPGPQCLLWTWLPQMNVTLRSFHKLRFSITPAPFLVLSHFPPHPTIVADGTMQAWALGIVFQSLVLLLA